MGIQGLTKLLNKIETGELPLEKYKKNVTEVCMKEKQLRDYNYTTQAIDTSNILYRFANTMKDGKNYEINGKIVVHLFSMFSKCISCLRFGIRPIMVLDGKPPKIKLDKIKARKECKNKMVLGNKIININEAEITQFSEAKKPFSLDSEKMNEVKKLLNLMGLGFIDSISEADPQCVALEKNGKADGIVSNDWDLLLFGCEKLLKNFSNKKPITEINTNLLLKTLGMTNQEQLIDLGCILGNDYCPGVKISEFEAYLKFEQSNFNMETFIINNQELIFPENFIEKWQAAREYYLHATVLKPEQFDTGWKKPDIIGLKNFLLKEIGFGKDVEHKINELILMYICYKLEFTYTKDLKHKKTKEKDQLMTIVDIKEIINELTKANECYRILKVISVKFSVDFKMNEINEIIYPPKYYPSNNKYPKNYSNFKKIYNQF